MSIFEKAARQKLRFPTSIGPLPVEMLWDLPLESKTGKANLDDLAKELNRQLRSSETSFVNPDKAADPAPQLRFDIVMHIIKVKMEENAAAKTAREKAQLKQFLLDAKAAKERDAILSKSPEEIQKLIDELGTAA